MITLKSCETKTVTSTKIPFTNGVLDEYVRECFKVNPSSVISWFLMCSYAYYQRYESLMSDEAFDKMCKWAHSNYDTIDHVNKGLVTKDMLQAGSGYNLSDDDYPLRVKISSVALITAYYNDRDCPNE